MSIKPEFREMRKFAGRKLPEKSNFSQTCNLLSQYLKEKGSFGDLGFGTAGSPRDSGKSPAMDLFPQHTGFGAGSSSDDVAIKNTDCSEIKQATMPKANQMTIIYAGKVLVFDDIGEDKVKELMSLASNVSMQNNTVLTPKLNLNTVNNLDEEGVPRPIPAHVSGLPIARKASLHRFLEKRKDRINARAPYQVNTSAVATTTTKPEETKTWLSQVNTSAAATTTTKPEETKTWLGLVSQPSLGLRL